MHDAHAGDVFGEGRRDEAKSLSHTLVRAVRARAEPARREGHERQDEERREGEAPVEQEQHDDGSDEDERVLHEARDAVRDELVERLDVVRDPTDDCAGPVPLVVAERQALQVAEELDAEVGERPLADPAGEVGLSTRQDEGRDACSHEGDDDERERVEIAGLDAVVDGELGQIRREQGDARVRDERCDGESRSCPVRACEAEEHADSPARLPPGPVLDLARPARHEMASELPDLHPATTCCRSPCS